MPQKPRVCIIGCGPSGMSALYHFAKMSDDKRPDVVCYEKQATWGGQWNPTWKIGMYTNEIGYVKQFSGASEKTGSVFIVFDI